tara:strand:+ start:2212 stop:4671 length:2460 start_codon:yes stop_codon:yes gene_type:complete
MADKENVKLMAAQLKKDRAETLAELKRIADTNTQIAKDTETSPEDRKKALKAAAKASKARDSLLKQDLSTGAAVKKEIGSIGSSLLSGFDGMLGEAFGPLGGIASTLTTGLIRRKIDQKKNLEADILQEEQSKEIAEELGGVKETVVEQLKEVEEQGGEQQDAESRREESRVQAEIAQEAQVERKTQTGVFTKILESQDFTNELLYDGLFGSPPLLQSLVDNQESKEDRRERMRKEKAKGSGGILSKVKKKEDGSMDIMGTLGNIAKFLLPAGALAKASAMLGTGLAALGVVALPLAVVGAAMKAIYDGFVGWMSAEDWGVSNISGALGGFFGGDAEGGIMNMFINAGKWAAIGAGIGSVVPVVGTIAGGLIGAAFGAIMGLIGGKKLAEGFDAIGKWFKDSFLAIWDVIMPDWVKQINFEWTDIFPTGLVKLFNGEYFTVDVPSFSWYSLFPNFLVEWFKGTAEKISDKPWSWTDIFPKFVVDFFTGAVAKEEYTFKWTDLFPTWLVKVLDSTAEAFDETPFTWYSLFPDWLVNIVKGVKITGGTDAFHWTDIFPGWMQKVFKAGKKEGTTEDGGFDWTRLLPDWLAPAWDSTKALAGKAKGGLENLWEMIKEIFQGLVDKVLGLLPLETVETVKEIIEDPVGMAKKGLDAAGGAISDTASDVYEGGKNLLSSGLSLIGFGDDTEGNARGGIIVNRPSYLPSTGTVVGEHGTWSGKGAARGGIPMDGGPEAIIPLTGNRAQGFIDPIARSIAGAVMNNLAMEKFAAQNVGMTGQPTVIDSSSQQIVTNNTIINSPDPHGPMLPGAGRDTAVSHFRHAA